MNVSYCIRQLSLALFLSVVVAGTSALAQPAKDEFQPQVGQAGKDVVWVPTPQALVDKMLDMAKVTPKDYVIDLGSGDGRTVITAAKRGAKALGIEYNPEMVELSKRNAAKEGVSDKANFVKADLFESDFSQAHGDHHVSAAGASIFNLRPKILDLKPGTRIVSNSFDMEDWKPDETPAASGCDHWCTAYLWIVPAKVAAHGNSPKGSLNAQTNFPDDYRHSEKRQCDDADNSGKLNGDQISFTAGANQYTGRVNGNAIEGTVSSGGSWKASRAGK